MHARKGQFHQFHKSRQLPRRLCPVAKGLSAACSGLNLWLVVVENGRHGTSHATGRRLSESRVRENLMHGLRWQGVETRAERDILPQAPLSDPTS